MPFRAASFTQTWVMLRAMFGHSVATLEPHLVSAQLFPRFQTVVLIGAVAWVVARMFSAEVEAGVRVPRPRWYPVASLAGLSLSIIHMTNSRFTPLIYFKF